MSYEGKTPDVPGTAEVRDIPLGHIPEPERLGLPTVGRERRARLTARIHVRSRVHTHSRARAHTLHIHTACFLRASPAPTWGGGPLSL